MRSMAELWFARRPLLVRVMNITPILILAANLVSAPLAECPSGPEVEAELIRLGAGHAPAGMQPEITIVGDRMRVVLRGPDGPVGSREVEAPSACHGRAIVAAVLVATWMGVWPEGREPAPPPTRPAQPLLSASPPPAAASPRASTSSSELALSLQAAHDGHAGALGAGLLAGRVLAGPVRVFIGACVLTERQAKIGPGSVAYMRPHLETGAALRGAQAHWTEEFGLSARWGLQLVRGQHFAPDHSAAHFVPGLAAHLRVSLGASALAPFGFVSAGYWLTRETVMLDNDPAQTDLPRWDVTIGLGISWSAGA